MREYMHVDKKYLDEIDKLKDRNRFRSPTRNEGPIITVRGLKKTLLLYCAITSSPIALPVSRDGTSHL